MLGGSHFFKNRRFWFLGQVLKTGLILKFCFPFWESPQFSQFQGRFSGTVFTSRFLHIMLFWFYNIYVRFFGVISCFFSYHQFVLWHETQFSSKFAAKLSLPCPIFSWTLSTNHCCWYVYCSYKCSRAGCI